MPINKNEITKEMIEKAMQCKTVDELIALAKTEGCEITNEEAEAYMAELADIELDGVKLKNVAGGGKVTSSSFANSRRFFCGCFVIIIVIQIVICEDANAWVNDMKKTDLAQKILAGVGSLTNTPVNDFNKKVLSDLANAEFTVDVDDKAVETAEKLLTAFLDDTWADQPQAHKYVIGS